MFFATTNFVIMGIAMICACRNNIALTIWFCTIELGFLFLYEMEKFQ